MDLFTPFCDKAQDALDKYFWSSENSLYNQTYPKSEEKLFCYWWHAHAIDVLIDAYIRTSDKKYLDKIEAEISGVRKKNGDTLLNNWYDDMEWMALALLRLYDITKNNDYKIEVEFLWEDIKTAWNDHQGGGLAWKKDQLDYKNTPANAPAAILAYRLYQRFNNPKDLEWADKIFNWNYDNLVDKETGFVWDGKNRLGDGAIDYDWEYTYCQGVFAGAAFEKYKISNDEQDLDIAVKTTTEAIRRLCDEKGGIIPYEGKDDCGLFKGIMLRYFLDIYLFSPQLSNIKNCIITNAESVINKAVDSRGLIGGCWDEIAAYPIDLAQHLSGIMVLEFAQVVSDE